MLSSRAQMRAMMVRNGIVGRVQAGYTADDGHADCPQAWRRASTRTAHLCSANSGSVPAHFCCYHAQITVQGIDFNYVVQPWTASVQLR